MSEKHQQQAEAVYHDWRERCLAAGGGHYISHIPLMEAAIAAALEAVEQGCQAENALLREQLAEEKEIRIKHQEDKALKLEAERDSLRAELEVWRQQETPGIAACMRLNAKLTAERDAAIADAARRQRYITECQQLIGTYGSVQAGIEYLIQEQEQLRAELTASQERERALREALQAQPCRCKCLTHGFGCGMEVATCRKDEGYACSRCAALATPEGTK